MILNHAIRVRFPLAVQSVLCYHTNMKLWDYKIPKNWQPPNDEAWIWYLERKINYGDWAGLKPAKIKKYWGKLKLDPGKKIMTQNYFDLYGAK